MKENRKRINIIAHKDIDINPQFQRPVDLEKFSKTISRKIYLNKCIHPAYIYLCDFFNDVFGSMVANPSDCDLKNAINEVFSENNVATSKTLYCNTRNGKLVFLNELTQTKNCTIFLRGTKGIGKTFFINHFLNNNSDRLLDRNNTIWFRVDYSMIYKEEFYKDSLRSGVSLTDYIDAHVTYITFAYRESLEIFKTIVDDSDLFQKSLDVVLDNNSKLKKHIEDPDSVLKLTNSLKKEIVSSTVLNKSLAKKQRKKIHNLLFRQGKRHELSVAGRTILHILKENKFNILFIIDGIDNLDYYANYKFYMKFISELVTFCYLPSLNHLYDSVKLICLRDETLDHIQFKDGYKYTDNLKEFTLKQPSIESILIKKINACQTAESIYFKKKKKYIQNKIEEYLQNQKGENVKGGVSNNQNFIQDQLESFSEFGVNFINNLVNSFRDVIPYQFIENSIDYNFIYEVIYGSNTRSFLFNYLNINKYKKTFVYQKISEKKKIYSIREGQLLNGRLYLNTENYPYEFGKVIPNIFYFPSHRKTDLWHGLAGYRILQFLTNTYCEYYSLIDKLVKLFSYEPNIIKRLLAFYIQHGLIKSKFVPTDKKQYFITTRKGLFMLIYPFCDVDILYHMAIDTPLPISSVNDSSLIQIHENEPYPWYKIPSSSIYSTLTFIRTIMSCHNYELYNLNDKHKDIFELNDIFPYLLIEQILEKLEQLSDEYPDVYSEVHDNLVKVDTNSVKKGKIKIKF